MSQIYRKLKADGIICILAPFNLSEHRYPVDCYRYYPDGLKALATWAGFTVIDATNSKTSEMNRYKELCSAYKYRMYCVDFTSLPIEVVKERNRNRPELKRVPDEAIDKMYFSAYISW